MVMPFASPVGGPAQERFSVPPEPWV